MKEAIEGRILPKRSIEEVRSEALNLLQNLAKEVQDGEKEELAEKEKTSPLGRAVINTKFINDKLSPLVSDLWLRKGDLAITLASDSRLGTFFLPENHITFGVYKSYRGAESGVWGSVREVKLGSNFINDLFSNEKFPHQLQKVWDEDQEGHRLVVERFGALTKAEIVFSVAQVTFKGIR